MELERGIPMSRQRPEGPDDRSIGELLREVYQDATTMVERQIALAKVEARNAVVAVGRGVAIVAAGALVGLVGFIYLMLAVVYGLSRVMPDWAAAGLVGLVLAAVGGIAIWLGAKRLKALAQPLPETRETLREDAQFAKEEAREFKERIARR
jgi:uncharacterized membrane protein YqjE